MNTTARTNARAAVEVELRQMLVADRLGDHLLRDDEIADRAQAIIALVITSERSS